MKHLNIQALLFDLGGVLIELDFDRAFEYWQPISKLSVAEIKSRFSFDIPYQQLERGQLSADEYFEHLCHILQLEPDFEHIQTGWNAIFPGEITETRQLVENVRANFPCYLLSNTNAVHKSAWSQQFPQVVQAFERLFISSEMGCRKPERAAFNHVAETLGIPLEAIMFFDDLLENVNGATAAGLTGVHVTCPGDIRTALQQLGCKV